MSDQQTTKPTWPELRERPRIICPYCGWEFAADYYDSTHVPCPEGPK